MSVNHQPFRVPLSVLQVVPPGGRTADGEPMFLRLNIGGTSYLLLVEAILRAEPTGFLAKFVQLNHKARLKVSGFQQDYLFKNYFLA